MKRFYTWQEYERDIKRIAAWAAAGNFDGVYGIPRGGLVVAVALSHRLGLPVVLEKENITPQTLVVDDISDSGKTLATFEQAIGHTPVVATLFWHNNTKRTPDFTCNEKTEWVVFPWETDETSRYDGTAAV